MIAVSQLVARFKFSQIWYVIVYVPAGVPAGTDTTPVVVFKVGTKAPGEAGVAGVTTVIVISERFNNGLPFKVSGPEPLSGSTFPTEGLPVAPLVEGNKSFCATIGATPTGIVMIAVSQLVARFKFSQIWYVIVYVPAGVPAGTDTTPVVVFKVGTKAPGEAGVAAVT